MRVSLAVAALVAPLLVTVVPAQVRADPPPTSDPYSGHFPACGVLPDDDGQYCVLSVTRNGVEIPPVDYGTPGTYYDPYVDLIPVGDGNVRFGVSRVVVPSGGGPPTFSGDVPPNDRYVFRVNTGAIQVRETYGNLRDVDVLTFGNAMSGYGFQLSLRPAPVAWVFYDPGFTCTFVGGCGDDSTLADLVYDGFVTGYITDLEATTFTPAERERRKGLITTYNAQFANYYYDATANAIVVELANPHLKAPGVPATGYFETFLPTDYLVNDMGIPYPDSLSGGSFTVRRAGVSTAVPYSLTHEPGGVRIRLSGIGFSTPKYTITTKPSKPGKPRITDVRRLDRQRARVAVRPPVADGGARVTGYQARCRTDDRPWRLQRDDDRVIVVDDLQRGRLSCQARAVNRLGAGRWSAPARP